MDDASGGGKTEHSGRVSGIPAVCYNISVKRQIFFRFSGVLLSLLFLCQISFPALAQDTGVEAFSASLQKRIQDRDWAAFSSAFIPEIREEQRAIIASYFDHLKMEEILAFPVRTGVLAEEEPILFFQVFFQNAYSGIFETWKLTLSRAGEGWEIKKKEVTGSLSNLYKIQIPSNRVEKAASVEIDHVDFKITFQNAHVFYDNIPHLDTALLVIGKGQVRFTPSDAIEKHQLELVYKKELIEEKLSYAFLRFSNSFFKNNIKIRGAVEVNPDGSEGEKAVAGQAFSLFSKHYLRYYAIQHSLSREPLSFLPQGEEAVIEFQGGKLGEFTYIYSPFAEEEINLYDNGNNRLISLYSPSVTPGQKRMFIKFSQKYHVEHYDIDLDFSPERKFLSAKARIELLPQVDNLDSLKFRFDSRLEILRVYDAEKRELVFTQDKAGNVLYVYFLAPQPKQAPTSIEVYYRGQLESPAQMNDVIAGPQFREAIIFSPLPLETYLYSQAVFWYPFPPGDDYFTSRLRLTVPRGFDAVATGDLAERGSLDSFQRLAETDKVGSSYFIFSSRFPVKYISFLVGKLNKLQDVVEPWPFQYYVTDYIRSPKKNASEEARSIVQFYEKLFGAYPYGSLRIIHRAWTTLGGHSPSSFIILNELPFSPDNSLYAGLTVKVDNPVDLSQWKEYYLAHELAHQWWGQGVTGAKYRDQWLSEGLAQFSSVLYLKSKYNHRAFSAILKRFSYWTERKSKWGPITLGSRLSYLDMYAYQSIIYNKSSLVLNMLMDMVGEEAFFAGLKEFFATHKYGAASTGDFFRIMEKASGEDLRSFFQPWFYSHLLPQVKAEASAVKRGEEHILRVSIEQSGETFVFPLWISWEENGRFRAEKVMVREKTQEAEFPASQKPSNIKINPDRAVPGKFD